MHEAVGKYIEANRGRILEELCTFLRFPSVSAQSDHREDMVACATWLRDHLIGIGMEAELVEGAGHPIVRARVAGRGKGKVIVYGHYDVQPPDPLGEWKSDPFEPRMEGDTLIARGATDDKGQLWAHVKAVEALLATGRRAGCEVEFLVEGEEECGGRFLAEYLSAQWDRLREGLIGVVVSDSDVPGLGQPAITYALRGLAALEVEVRTLARDVHSGTYGGAAGNAVLALAGMLAKCVGADGRVQVEGFYDGVRESADWERQNAAKAGIEEAALAAQLGAPGLFGEAGYSAVERIWSRPTFEVNGMIGGYTGEGSKTIVPAVASAKITMRLVPDQDPSTVQEAAARYLENVCPAWARCEVKRKFTAAPLLFDVEGPLYEAARGALEAGFGRSPLYTRCGGSIPVVEAFWRELGRPVLLMGLGLADDGAHSPNEKFELAHLWAGAKASAALLESLGG